MLDLKKAFELIHSLDKKNDAGVFVENDVDLWPLIRSRLWLYLINEHGKTVSSKSGSGFFCFFKVWVSKAERLLVSFLFNKKKFGKIDVLFFSRPVYLERISKNKIVDRIVDPLVEMESRTYQVGKLYVSPFSFSKIPWKGSNVVSGIWKKKRYKKNLSNQFKNEVAALLDEFSIDVPLEKFIGLLSQDYIRFCFFYHEMTKLFKATPSLKRIYIASWYFPDMMGVIAAAKEYGVIAIDIQHGKQGKYQAMYNGWDSLNVKKKFKLLPDFFWCWGEPTKKEIFKTGRNRCSHFPIVGGFLWPDFYSQHNAKNLQHQAVDHPVLLFTMQPPQANNKSRIPAFLLKLMSEMKNLHVIFRPHPNDINARNEIIKVLNTQDFNYSVSNVDATMYDDILLCSHHITAYSSSCYEAELFKKPTMLFGVEAKSLYEKEIVSKRFSWTSGHSSEVRSWLQSGCSEMEVSDDKYIITDQNVSTHAISCFEACKK